MKNFKEISLGVLAVLVVIMIWEIYYVFGNKLSETDLNKIDVNQDGVISRREVQLMLQEQEKNKFNHKSVIKSIVSGSFRGCVTGLLLNGIEGAITGGIVMGIINPIILGAEQIV